MAKWEDEESEFFAFFEPSMNNGPEGTNKWIVNKWIVVVSN